MFRLPRSLDLLVAPILVPEHGMARPFTPRTSRLVACPEMWHHYVFDRAINTTGLSPAGSQNCRLLHLGGTRYGFLFRDIDPSSFRNAWRTTWASGRPATLNRSSESDFREYSSWVPSPERM